MYEPLALTISSEECHRLIKAGGSLIHKAGSGHPYHTTPSDDTIALYEPLLGDRFTGAWLYAQLVILFPGGALTQHTDGQLGRSRRHLVLQTNPHVWIFHDGAWQQLPLGGVYSMDPTKPHGAVNWGHAPRVHLLMDVAAEGGDTA